ncbi:MAG: hypothetical protein M3442_18570 [Chloroflexota bacterium]|nr:hypothetical protein [Chloroflexota bacterium]
MSDTLRPLVMPVSAAFLCTVLLALWLRARPLAMPTIVQVLLSVILVAVVAVVLALVQRVERDITLTEPR